jgi:hypothetical protein
MAMGDISDPPSEVSNGTHFKGGFIRWLEILSTTARFRVEAV